MRQLFKMQIDEYVVIIYYIVFSPAWFQLKSYLTIMWRFQMKTYLIFR